MSRQALDELKQQIPLLEYLHAHDWKQAKPIGFGRLLGLCPLHADHKPSFLVDPHKNLFYCYGCRRGGDVIRFAELYHQVKFPQAVALLHQWRGLPPLLHEAAGFYRMQLHRHAEAVAYLYQRGVRAPELIEHMRIPPNATLALRSRTLKPEPACRGVRPAGTHHLPAPLGMSRRHRSESSVLRGAGLMLCRPVEYRKDDLCETVCTAQ